MIVFNRCISLPDFSLETFWAFRELTADLNSPSSCSWASSCTRKATSADGEGARRRGRGEGGGVRGGGGGGEGGEGGEVRGEGRVMRGEREGGRRGKEER